MKQPSKPPTAEEKAIHLETKQPRARQRSRGLIHPNQRESQSHDCSVSSDCLLRVSCDPGVALERCDDGDGKDQPILSVNCID
jgi:hypothetical protein